MIRKVEIAFDDLCIKKLISESVQLELRRCPSLYEAYGVKKNCKES